jgi:hypothetical protein
MALKVKDAASSASKFVARAQAAGPAYQAGVQGAGDMWQANSTAAEASFGAGVTAAVSAKRYSRGVQKAGAAKYVSKASGVGAARYPQGVANAGPAWQQGVQPYLDTLAGITLPPRAPRGDPGNVQRVAAVAAALHAKKIGS